MESELSHPLIAQLRPIFAELHHCAPGELSSAISKLDYIIEEEKDALFRRDNTVRTANSVNVSRALTNYINQNIRDLFAKQRTQFAGIYVIRSLLDVEYDDLNEKTKLFSELLVACTFECTEKELGLVACDTWGNLLVNGSNVHESIISNCLGYSISLLYIDSYDTKFFEGADVPLNAHSERPTTTSSTTTKLAGCVFIAQLMKRVPSNVSPFVNSILGGLRTAAIDRNPYCRTKCEVALQSTLRVTYRSADPSFCRQWQDTFMGDVLRGLHYGQEEVLDGCLKTFNSLLTSVVDGGADSLVVEFSSFASRAVKEVWTYILDNIGGVPPNSDVKREMLRAFPLLAKYDNTWFKVYSANKVFEIAYNIFAATEGPDERPMMFDTLGRLVLVLPELIPSWVDRIMSYIEKSLINQSFRPRCQEAVSCFATLSEAGAGYVRPYIRHILGSLFAGPISVAATEDVARLCAAFPELRSNCLSKMLEATKLELQNRSAREGCASDSQFVVNIMNALLTLDFTGYSTLEFLNDCILQYVSDPQEVIRRCAIDVCFKLVLSGCTGSPCERDASMVVIHRGREHIGLVNSVIRKLVNAAVADSESDIRLHTLEKLTCEYDNTLALQSIASSLFPALHDKHQNRIAAVRLLGRVSTRNPACIYPMLRRILVQCTTDIQLFQLPKRREQATVVVSALVESAPDMIHPYVTSLLTECSTQLRDPEKPTSMQTALLSCIGKLSLYAEGENIPILNAIRPVVIQHILDSSNLVKKQEAIRTLGNIIRTTKDVDVYSSNPELLHVLLSALHGGYKETWPVRSDVLELMGIVGAVDPVKVKDIFRTLRDGQERASPETVISAGESAVAQNVVKNVLDVLNLPSLSDEQCISAVKVLSSILSLKDTIGGSLIPFYNDIISVVCLHAQQRVKKRCDLIRELAKMATILRQHIRPFMSELLAVLVGFMPGADQRVLVEVLRLLSALRHSLREEFKPYLPQLFPPIVNTALANPVIACVPVFAFFVEMGILLDEHLHNVLPCVCDFAGNVALPYSCRAAAVDTLRQFAKRLPRLALHGSRCVHCLCHILREDELIANGTTKPLETMNSTEEQESERRPADNLVNISLDALRLVARNLGSDFEKFTLTVFPTLELYGEGGREVCAAIQSSVKLGGRVQVDHSSNNPCETYLSSPQSAGNNEKWTDEQFESLQKLLNLRDLQTEEDWNNWLRKLSVEFLSCSPSASHKFAFPLAHIHEPFARRMLYSAFAVCYREMKQSMKEKVTNLLGSVLRDDRVPSEVLQELLNLAEFMERLEMHFNPNTNQTTRKSGLLFDLKTLMDSSERCNLYSKALHYVEIQFYEITKSFEHNLQIGKPLQLPAEEWKQFVQLCEKSIYLCNLLNQRESAEGILKYIQNHFFFLTGKSESEMPQLMDAQLLEKLQWWSQSLQAYEQGLREEPSNFNNMVGFMRSLDNLGDYGRLLESWKTFSVRVGKKEAADMAPFGAHAAWLLRRWDDMDKIVSIMPDEGYKGTTAVFYRAVLAVHRRDYREAEPLINSCRKRLDASLSALVAESYDRAYDLLVGIQQLSELQEIAFVAKQTTSTNPHLHNDRKRFQWRELWEKRLQSTAYEGWPGTLANHTLVLPPEDEIDMWLQFVSLARKSGRERFASDILFELLGSHPIDVAIQQPNLPQPAIALAAFRHLYATNEKASAEHLLSSYLEKAERCNLFYNEKNLESLAKCHSQLAYWLFSDSLKKKQHFKPATIAQIKQHLDRATMLDEENGTIWHTWARFHHSLITEPATKKDARGAKTTEEVSVEYVIAALSGYIRSIFLSEELEDVLGFLSLWFTYCSNPVIQGNTTIQEELFQVSPNVWLKVIPQIIARIYSSDASLMESVYQLLSVVASSHPQALLYNLNVTNISAASSSASGEQLERRKASQRILAHIVDTHPNGRTLVADVGLVCEELVRCAVLWSELWFDELERTWHNWDRDQNVNNVLLSLAPLMEQLNCPQTMVETHFVSEFGELLQQACQSVQMAAESGNSSYMDQAWTTFKTVVKRMNDQIDGMSTLALQLVSPKLAQYGKDLSIVVPGQYNESGVYPRIASFQNTLRVMNSKQHPRRLYINGTDGVLYKFLLKGHEDLRLDERVMQLLGFVNTLLDKQSAMKQRDFMIQTYSATPLSDNAGLVGWVDHCSTLHQLIREYRVHQKYLEMEVKYMASFGVALERLTNIQHVEPFEYTLLQTEGTDIANSLWMKAPSAESWLDRRTTYVCSLATMSMVGHILGLGDRHPSNLMIHAFSGRVVHIDFGDCFEIAQQRSIVPERVPFRLTRMLVKAMEMGGIEGLFRHGSISVMSVLRSEGSSILALLEAFVHDPLVMWWRDNDLVSAEPPRPHDRKASAAFLDLGQSFRSQKKMGASTVGSLHPRTFKSSYLAAPNGEKKTNHKDQQSSKAQQVIYRIKEKLEGREFRRPTCSRKRTAEEDGLPVEAQVGRLIEEATSNENLCVHFQGWCPFW
ncbi:FKBP12-rapamycin complex-associated protein [Angomonas deanei]|uniref:Serine/threonine-protein kinase TOR n=1 Tax=Angomonas deanei TaxID=59799 RepID=A0A7G2C202_9TRYP|nr:FKBP12-rapamycin complex-associated protein [Angomonas deanei]CAD2213251.1 Domain of unknown function (DUF3385)/FAT domain/FKBP12-rapamycin binding domain/Phosphatidylinositol 3- and 4-kinase/FATC domain containing protein, putative [Angomonas deanei]|eukprot:EPY33455.1 FKBP12-rapamycin complex-associated protein [Angomonas deanei]